METSLLPISSSNSPKKKGGLLTPQNIVGAGIFVGALYLAKTFIFPFLIGLLGQMVVLGLYGVILSPAILFVINPRFRARVKAWYGEHIDDLTDKLFPVKPITIMKNYIKSLYDKMDIMKEQIEKLNGAERNMEDDYNDNLKEIKNNKDLYDVATRQGSPQAQVYANQVGRLTAANADCLPIINQLKGYVGKLDKMQEAADLMIQDMSNDIKLKEKKYKAITAAYSAIKTAMAMLDGNTNERQEFENSLEKMKEDMSNKVAEFDHIMSKNDSILANIDIQKGVLDLKGQQAIADLDKIDLQQLLRPLGDTTPSPVKLVTQSSTPNTGKYSKYLNQ